MNTMYRNAHPPSGQNEPFEFFGSFMGAFMANEPANQMLNFGSDSWKYQIEWYRTPMMGMMGSEMDMVSFSLTIGRWSSMGMMMMVYVPFFSAMGLGLPGSFDSRTRVEGFATPIPGMSNFAFMPGDVLSAMVMFMTSPTSFNLTVPLANSCLITSPVSDPGYPFSGVGVPTLSQWGALVLAILLPFLYTFVIRRRIRMGRS